VPEASVFSSMFSGDDTYIKSFVTEVLQVDTETQPKAHLVYAPP